MIIYKIALYGYKKIDFLPMLIQLILCLDANSGMRNLLYFAYNVCK